MDLFLKITVKTYLNIKRLIFVDWIALALQASLLLGVIISAAMIKCIYEKLFSDEKDTAHGRIMTALYDTPKHLSKIWFQLAGTLFTPSHLSTRGQQSGEEKDFLIQKPINQVHNLLQRFYRWTFELQNTDYPMKNTCCPILNVFICSEN